MAHNYNDNGTVYEIGGGKVNMNGTAYEIDHGKYNDNGTVYELSFGPTLITFYISLPASMGGKTFTYSCEPGMTWANFINSGYNTGKKFALYGSQQIVCYDNYSYVVANGSTDQYATNTIIANNTYKAHF